MGSATDAGRVAATMLSWQSLELVSLRKIQSLWADYGYICEVTARATNADASARMRDMYGDIGDSDEQGPQTFPLILKFISPPPMPAGTEDEGHLRKIMSYEAELNFYNSVAPRLGKDLPMARCVAATKGRPDSGIPEGVTATLITDLRLKYPIAAEKRASLNEKHIHAALSWLSDFHRRSWAILPLPEDELMLPPLEEARKKPRAGKTGDAIWLNGGYTYLATRRTEYAALAQDSSSEWSSALCKPLTPRGPSIAEMVARALTPRGREQETVIHGDVKSENFFTTQSGSEVAFYDFQYVGLGLGVCDLAKFFTCSVPVHMLTDKDGSVELHMDEGEKRLLQQYWDGLLYQTGKSYDWDIFVRHWETALVDWLRFQASWGFWGNTGWLEARVRSILNDQAWRDWLHDEQFVIDREINSPVRN